MGLLSPLGRRCRITAPKPFWLARLSRITGRLRSQWTNTWEDESESLALKKACSHWKDHLKSISKALT